MPEAGDVAVVLVQYAGEPNGKVLVRLPDGSTTSLPFACLDLVVRGGDLPRPAGTDDLSAGP
jgi:hypothetical protein